MSNTWKQIDAWLSQNATQALASLRPGTSAQTLDDLAMRLGFPLPDQLREHLSAHDGQPSDSLLGMLDGWIFLNADTHRGLTDMLNAGEFEEFSAVSCDGLAKAPWWSERWIPFLESPGGDYLVVDLDPTENGEPGQITHFQHDEGDPKIRAESLDDLPKEFLEDLESDQCAISPKGGLRRVQLAFGN